MADMKTEFTNFMIAGANNLSEAQEKLMYAIFDSLNPGQQMKFVQALDSIREEAYADGMCDQALDGDIYIEH